RYEVATGRFQTTFQGNASASTVNRLANVGLTSGSLSFSGTASGTTAHPILTASISGTNIAMGSFHFGDLTADLRSNGTILQASFSLPEYSATGNATYAFNTHRYQLEGAFSNLALDSVRSSLPQTAQNVQ